MRKYLLTVCAAMLACACFALPRAYVIPLSTGAATGNTNTLDGVFGKVVEVYASCSDGVSTGNVAIAYVPLDGKTAAVNVSTGVVTASKLWRPTVDSTDVAGDALASDAPGAFYISGETLRLIVMGSPTNKTWKATIKVDR